MTRRTTEITRTVRELTIEHVTALDGKKYPAVMITLKRFEELCRADDSAVAMIDGYPTKTPMASAPATTTRSDDPDDIGDDTPVEIAALAVLKHGMYPRDKIAEARREAEHCVTVIAAEFVHLGRTLDRVDRLRSTTPIVATDYCHVAKLRGLPFDPIWAIFRHTTFKKSLTPAWSEEHGVSRWVYDFVRRTHRLPTEDEMRQRLALEVAAKDTFDELRQRAAVKTSVAHRVAEIARTKGKAAAYEALHSPYSR